MKVFTNYQFFLALSFELFSVSVDVISLECNIKAIFHRLFEAVFYRRIHISIDDSMSCMRYLL